MNTRATKYVRPVPSDVKIKPEWTSKQRQGFSIIRRKAKERVEEKERLQMEKLEKDMRRNEEAIERLRKRHPEYFENKGSTMNKIKSEFR